MTFRPISFALKAATWLIGYEDQTKVLKQYLSVSLQVV